MSDPSIHELEAALRAKRIAGAMDDPYTGGIWEGRRFNRKPFVTIRLADAQALLADLDHHKAIAAELVGKLEQIELIATNHGGWFETDAWLWGQSMGSFAKEGVNFARESGICSQYTALAKHKDAGL